MICVFTIPITVTLIQVFIWNGLQIPKNTNFSVDTRNAQFQMSLEVSWKKSHFYQYLFNWLMPDMASPKVTKLCDIWRRFGNGSIFEELSTSIWRLALDFTVGLSSIRKSSMKYWPWSSMDSNAPCAPPKEQRIVFPEKW